MPQRPDAQAAEPAEPADGDQPGADRSPTKPGPRPVDTTMTELQVDPGVDVAVASGASQHPGAVHPVSGYVVDDHRLVTPQDPATRPGQATTEVRVLPAGDPEPHIEPHGSLLDLPQVQQQVVRGGGREHRPGPARRPVEETAGGHPGVHRAAELGHHAPGHQDRTVPPPGPQQATEPARPRRLVVVDHHQEIGRGGLVQDPVAYSRQAGLRLDHIAHPFGAQRPPHRTGRARPGRCPPAARRPRTRPGPAGAGRRPGRGGAEPTEPARSAGEKWAPPR